MDAMWSTKVGDSPCAIAFWLQGAASFTWGGEAHPNTFRISRGDTSKVHSRITDASPARGAPPRAYKSNIIRRRRASSATRKQSAIEAIHSLHAATAAHAHICGGRRGRSMEAQMASISCTKSYTACAECPYRVPCLYDVCSTKECVMAGIWEG